jgi:transposase
MKRRHWTEKEKFTIVVEGLQSEVKISELCNHHGIQQSQYYAWRDLFLKNGSKVFMLDKQSRHEQVLEHRIKKMQQVIGELTLELKKND